MQAGRQDSPSSRQRKGGLRRNRLEGWLRLLSAAMPARVKTGAQRILTTHAGSLPRPRALTELHAAKASGQVVDESALRDGAEQATRDVIARQMDVGLDVVNNGEVGRESFFTYVRHRMSGFSGQSSRPVMADLTEYPGFLELVVRQMTAGADVSLMTAPRATAAVAYLGPLAIEAECEQLQRLLQAHQGAFSEAFVSSPSPGIVAAAMENAFYDDLPAYVDAIAAALKTEYEAIAGAGFVLQIDAPDLAMERHTLFHGKPLADFLAFVRSVIGALNRALVNVPRDRVRLHVCWGNYEGPHDLDVPLYEIWSEITRAAVGGFMLSMANPRHAHEVRLFDKGILPPGTVLLPGVIDTTTNYVEHPEVVSERIERAVKAVGDPHRVIASTDCGFETSAGFAMVAPDVVWAKLRALVLGAELATRRLL
jgi:5-methyltetrahydropteroyltriglutamate--homocysteine methyltransferase